jgi:hypothetical protein
VLLWLSFDRDVGLEEGFANRKQHSPRMTGRTTFPDELMEVRVIRMSSSRTTDC